MSRIGPYSSAATLATIDGRTREGRLLKATRVDLTSHVGGAPSATQRAMIDRAAMLALHLALMDEKTAAGKPMTEYDSKAYLAWTNTYTRLMRHLGLQGKAQRPATLREHIAARAAAP